ncbi:MAG: methyltransferase domain-containing protein [Cytophagales bacterium]
MKFLDRVLQNWRTSKAIKYIPINAEVLDIGCYDAIVFQKLGNKLQYGVGIDPLIEPIQKANYELKKGYFPQDLDEKNKYFDAITLTAVLEHIPESIVADFAQNCSLHLKSKGIIAITVPDPKVDKILEILIKFKILDGMSVDEHHGYDVKQTIPLFEKVGLKLIKKESFQLGLNNLFVFQKP